MPRSTKLRSTIWAAAAAAAIVSAGVLWYRFRPDADPPRGEAVATVFERFHKPDPPPAGYVGSRACAECHPEIAESFRRHPMGQSARLVTQRDAAPPKSRADRLSFSAAAGLEYRIRREGTRVVHEEVLNDESGNAVFRDSAPVDYVVGSGKRGHSYLIDRGGLLFVSPIAWYSQKQRWDLSPGYKPFHHERFERPAPGLCLRCHVGRLNPRPDFPDRFRRPVFLQASIGCENCHGPGAGHVRYRRSTEPQGSDPMLKLGQLAPPLRESVCIQCHLSGQDVVLRYGRTPFDFRPGMHVTDVFCVLIRGATDKSDAKAVSQVEQLHTSRCYQKSAGRLGCISCHDPHSVPPASERVSIYRKRCLKCHTGPNHECSLPEAIRSDTTHGNSCISCHMPRFGASDVPHTTQTDHRIPRIAAAGRDPQSSDEPPSFERMGIFGGTGLPEAARVRARNIMLARIADRRNSPRHAEQALRALLPVLKAVPDDPETLDALARCCTVLRRPEEAVGYWTKALQHSPHDLQTLDNLSAFLHQNGRNRDSLPYLDRFLAENPWHADVYWRRSRVLASLGRSTDAVRDAQQAVKRNPSESRFQFWLAELYGRSNRTDESRRIREKAELLQRIWRRGARGDGSVK